MKRLIRILAISPCLIILPSVTAVLAKVEYRQIIKKRYEAVDQKPGGSFVIFSGREKIFYGLDPKFFPAARLVEVTQIAPTVGSVTLAFCGNQNRG
jgi:hypothetical protein